MGSDKNVFAILYQRKGIHIKLHEVISKHMTVLMCVKNKLKFNMRPKIEGAEQAAKWT